MNAIELEAKAKINLSIDVLGKRPDDYHDVRMVMQSIKLHDRITIEKRNTGIELTCQSPWVPNDNRNTAYKAAEFIIEKYDLKSGVSIKIEKNIPVAAGLAGGSADAAAVLIGINQLFSLDIDKKTLMDVGKKVGADVPFCIMGGTALAEGIGEVLTELAPLKGVNIVLAKPKIGVSTQWVYNNLIIEKIQDRPDTEALIQTIKEADINAIARNMKNVLETVTIRKYGIIDEIKSKFLQLGALGSIMSGSGPTVFGIFESGEAAGKAYLGMKSTKWDVFLTETC